jgi:hypothetical protein
MACECESPVAHYPHHTYEQLVSSPRPELKIVTEREGSIEYIGADNTSFGNDNIADWFAEKLAGRTSA